MTQCLAKCVQNGIKVDYPCRFSHFINPLSPEVILELLFFRSDMNESKEKLAKRVSLIENV